MSAADFAQGSPEWFKARVGRVTASRIKDVCASGKGGAPSITREAYMGELIAERLTGESAGDTYTNADMQRGTELEPLARAAYETRTKQMVDEVGLVIHPRNDSFAASPDGMVGADGLLEIKCPRTHVHISYLLAGKPPAAYLPQMAWQAFCCERPWVDFVSFDPKMPEALQLFIVRYVPELEYLRSLEQQAVAFLEELDGKLAALRRLVPTFVDDTKGRCDRATRAHAATA
jgi:putative phage-type endonuclease